MHESPSSPAKGVPRALSSDERADLRRRWRPLVPLAIAILSLVALVLVLLRVEHRTRAILNSLANVVDPAHAAVTDIELALALEVSASRGYLASGDVQFATNHLVARAARQRAEARLIPLARQIGPDIVQAVVSLTKRANDADATADSVYDGRLPKAVFLARLDEQQARFASIVAEAGRTDAAILQAAASSRRTVATTQRLGTILASLLILVALITLPLMARVVSRFQDLALRLDVQRWQQSALREAAWRLNASVSLTDAAQIVADRAVSATSALRAMAELARDDGQGAVSLGTASPGHASQSTTIGYQGSLTQEVANAGATTTHAATESLLAKVDPRTPATVEGHHGIVIPLVSERRVRGALAVVWQRGAPRVEQAEISYFEALVDLAPSVLRRADLVNALRESEERFHQVAENIRGFIWLREPVSLKILYANAAYESIWGRSRESLYQNPLSFIEGVHQDDRERVYGLVAQPRATEYDVEYRVVRPDGELRWVWSRGFPVRDDRGEVYRMAGVTEDITERKLSEFAREKLVDRERAARAASEAAQATAERRREELERIGESRVRLVRGFTHDVKNPLGAADGFLALLEEGVFGTLEERQRESVARARGSIRRALELIGGALELARAEAGELTLRTVELDLGSVIQEAVLEYRSQAEAKELGMNLVAARDVPAITSDPLRIRQIVGNLLSNAIKYTPSGGRVDVHVGRAGATAPAPGDWVVVSVSDTGRGIPAKMIPHVFDEFARIDPRDRTGAGVGLAISQRLARAIGGMLTVESREGAGSRFSLWLPHPNRRSIDAMRMRRRERWTQAD